MSHTTDDAHMDNLDFETDELPDAGLLAADSKLSPNGQYMANSNITESVSDGRPC